MIMQLHYDLFNLVWSKRTPFDFVQGEEALHGLFRIWPSLGIFPWHSLLAGLGWSWSVVPDGTDLSSLVPAWRGDLHPRPFLCWQLGALGNQWRWGSECCRTHKIWTVRASETRIHVKKTTKSIEKHTFYCKWWNVAYVLSVDFVPRSKCEKKMDLFSRSKWLSVAIDWDDLRCAALRAFKCTIIEIFSQIIFARDPIWGCSTILALAMGIDLYQILLLLDS